MPELGDVEPWNPARGPDDRHPTRGLQVDHVVRPLGGWVLGRGFHGTRRRALLFERGLGPIHPGMLAARTDRAIHMRRVQGPCSSTPGCSSANASPVKVDMGTNVGRSAP